MTSNNVMTTLRYKVPCKFSKSGFHDVVVCLGFKQELKFLSSECLIKHGEGVRVFQELNPEDLDTCYATVAVWEAAWQDRETWISDSHRLFPRIKNMPLGITRMLMAAHSAAVKIHRSRRVDNFLDTTDMKTKLLERAINRVAHNTIQRGLESFDGLKFDCVPRYFEVSRPVNMSGLKYQFLLNEDPPLGSHTLQTSSTSIPFALRFPNGTWHLSEDRIKTLAERIHSLWGSAPEKVCEICGEKFERMTKHTGGAKHQGKLIDLVKLVTKATSRTGLHFFNNRRMRTAFIK